MNSSIISKTICALFLLTSLTAKAETGDNNAHAAAVYGRSAAIPYYNRANRYLNQGRYEEAAMDLEEAIRLYPNDPDFCTNLGVAYRKLGRYADAEREFKTAISFNRDDWMNWSNLANAYLKQDMLEKTVATFQEALKHHPPATDAEAMKQDIKDINKVLAQRAGAKPPAKPESGKPVKTAASKRQGSDTKQTTGTATAVKRSAGPAIPLNETFNSSMSTTPSATTKAGSDWGYDAGETTQREK